jgi:hypothetical protein
LQENGLSHWLQGNGFSPVCILMCFFRTPESEKDLPHWLQGNVFSLVYPQVCL